MHLLRSDTHAGITGRLPGFYVLGCYRILVGVLFAMHGTQKLFGLPESPRGGGTVPFGEWPGWWAGVIELGGGVLVALGVATRPAALLCSGAMAYAYLTAHHRMSAFFPIENGGELAVMYCWAFFLLAFTGPGAFALASSSALDLRRRRRARTVAAR